jgi:hypothetical protein
MQHNPGTIVEGNACRDRFEPFVNAVVTGAIPFSRLFGRFVISCTCKKHTWECSDFYNGQVRQLDIATVFDVCMRHKKALLELSNIEDEIGAVCWLYRYDRVSWAVGVWPLLSHRDPPTTPPTPKNKPLTWDDFVAKALPLVRFPPDTITRSGLHALLTHGLVKSVPPHLRSDVTACDVTVYTGLLDAEPRCGAVIRQFRFGKYSGGFIRAIHRGCTDHTGLPTLPEEIVLSIIEFAYGIHLTTAELAAIVGA